MKVKGLFYFATDKEIHDLIMSSQKMLPTHALLDLARDRGIFYSPEDSRDFIAKTISLLPHDYHALNSLLDHRDHAGRAEKTKSVTLKAELTVEEIREVVRAYSDEAPPSEKVATEKTGDSSYKMDVKYSEIDYSLNRLSQKKSKVASIEFQSGGGETIISLPANAKAEAIVEELQKKIEEKKGKEIEAVKVELSEFSSAATRTQFFLALITSLDGFDFYDVSNVKVESKQPLTADDIEDEATEEEKQEVISFVKNIAMRGHGLLSSPEFQQLKDKGFYITSMTWQSKKQSSYDIVEFEAGFDLPEEGKGFKYATRGTHIFEGGEYTKTLRPIQTEEKKELLNLIVRTAHGVIESLKEHQKAS